MKLGENIDAGADGCQDFRPLFFIRSPAFCKADSNMDGQDGQDFCFEILDLRFEAGSSATP